MMASRYIPPALRRRQQDSKESESTASTSELTQADNALPIRKLEDLKIDGRKHRSTNPRAQDPNALALEEIHIHFSGLLYAAASRSTLNDSSERQKQLAYVMLFSGANPRWDSEHILFAKTNIDFLPGYEEAFKCITDAEMSVTIPNKAVSVSASNKGAAPASSGGGGETGSSIETLATHRRSPYDVDAPPDSPLIPVFTEYPHKGWFLLSGFYRLQRVSFLHPHSQELARMMAQKWDIRDKYGRPKDVRRSKEAWEESLRVRWAVIKMEKVEDEDQKLEIERFGDPKAIREAAVGEREEAESKQSQSKEETEATETGPKLSTTSVSEVGVGRAGAERSQN